MFICSLSTNNKKLKNITMRKTLLLLLVFLGIGLSSYSQTTQTVAEDFTVKDLNGNTYHLFDILDSGKYVYLEFSFIG